MIDFIEQLNEPPYDRTLYVWRNGIPIGQSPVEFNAEDQSLPEGVFLMLEGPDTPDPKHPGQELHPWSVLSLTGDKVKGDLTTYMRGNFNLPKDFRVALNTHLTPGTLFLATRESSTKKTRSGEMAIGVPDEISEPSQ